MRPKIQVNKVNNLRHNESSTNEWCGAGEEEADLDREDVFWRLGGKWKEESKLCK